MRRFRDKKIPRSWISNVGWLTFIGGMLALGITEGWTDGPSGASRLYYIAGCGLGLAMGNLLTERNENIDAMRKLRERQENEA